MLVISYVDIDSVVSWLVVWWPPGKSRTTQTVLQAQALMLYLVIWPLEAEYFLEAMDMFRAKYKRVVFLYVSDDIQWAERKLGK